jgi:hypothetical protein
MPIVSVYFRELKGDQPLLFWEVIRGMYLIR